MRKNRPVGMDERMADVDFVLKKVREEIERAFLGHRPYNSAHEAWAVIREEVDELWDEVKANNGYTPNAFTEAEQVAATAVRYIVDLAHRLELDHG